MLAALAQMVACLPLVQQIRGSIPGGVENFNLNIFNLSFASPTSQALHLRHLANRPCMNL